MYVLLLAVCATLAHLIPLMYAIHNITYDCTAAGDINVLNPHVDIYKSATAADWTGSLCNVTMTANLLHITVSGCDKSNDILVTFSDRATNGSIGDGIIGGSYSETQVLRCQEIVLEGIMFGQGVGFNMVTHSRMHNSVYFSKPEGEIANLEHLTPLSPTIPFVSSIWTQDGATQISSAYVTDSVMWKIEGPVEYDIFPMTCTAYGQTIGSSYSKLLIVNGCSQDAGLVWDVQSDVDLSIIKIFFSVFRFTLSEELILSCTLKICLNESISCQWTSCIDSRRRRMALNKDGAVTHLATAVAHLTVLSRLTRHHSMDVQSKAIPFDSVSPLVTCGVFWVIVKLVM